MGMSFDPKKFTEIPIEELITPKDNHQVILNNYWIISPNGHALIYTHCGSYAVQSNPVKEIADLVVYDGCTIKFIEQAYVKIKH